MIQRLTVLTFTLMAALALSACGRVGPLEPPPGKEKITTPLPKAPEQPKANLRPVAEPLMPLPRIAPQYPTAENVKPKPQKPQRNFFLDPLL